jgi:hypothetical protein
VLLPNIHTAYHFTLLSFEPSQREHHACGIEYPSSSCSYEVGGNKCALHSCCSINRVLIVQCCRDEEVCRYSLIEDVFVPFPSGEGRVLMRSSDKEARGNRVETGTGMIHQDRNGCGHPNEDGCIDDGQLAMEFWPDDRPGAVVKIYPDELGDGEGCDHLLATSKT